MLSPWQLPVCAVFRGREIPIHADYRDILEIFSYLEDPDLPAYVRWEIALGLFYAQPVPEPDRAEALDFFLSFIRCGQPESRPAPKLLDWEQDAAAIASDVNRVAGREIRSLPFVHWWTFLSWFHGIGQGQLSTLVGIREKLRKGKKLEPWEQEYYRENKQAVDLKPRYSRQELARQAALQAKLGR